MTSTHAAPPPLVDDGLTDEALVGRARARDEAAVRALTRRYNQRLFRIARSVLRNDGEAEDVVQEAYVRAFTGLEQFREESSFGTWVTRIALNEALGRLRRRKPVVSWDTESEERLQAHVLPFPSPSFTSDPESKMAQRQLKVLLEQAIDDLPDVFRAVFVARIVEGMSVEDTAALFGIRPETVKTRVHRARLRLQANLADQMGPMMPGAFAFAGARCARITEAVVARLELGDR